ncbi:MAG TPA: HAD-IA family hydrolase [Fimbriimonadaceae bacterium]|nr:haloacid dehalogenase [Armatimonadota bacterium]HCM74392.1 haloacid dehalogenase [Armatimonadota bacterium]HRD31730.1 HAD-IA family hydrolase [Fimbriimonadaceae bacterium]HRE93047.1 HAD-IA family hydrolase [Fimbriimonadaceae bacterium]HRI75302.1 HAD-IA family hydrolase [Fimbriimonadaceae bacterium]
MLRYQGVVFDFDGLILDTESREFDSWSETFASLGATLEHSEWIKCVGAPPGSWDVFGHLEALIGPYDRPLVEHQRMMRFHELMGNPPVPRAGVRELIEGLQEAGMPLAIASNSVFAWIDGFLRRMGLREVFPVIMSRDVVGVCKPDPASFLAACRALGLPPSSVLAFEDSQNGALAARAAGMDVVVVPNPVTEGTIVGFEPRASFPTAAEILSA